MLVQVEQNHLTLPQLVVCNKLSPPSPIQCTLLAPLVTLHSVCMFVCLECQPISRQVVEMNPFIAWHNLFVFGSFTSMSLTGTHYSYLPLISKCAQICPSAVRCTYRNVLPCCFRPVKVGWLVSGRFFDNLAPVSLCLLRMGPTPIVLVKNLSLTHFHVGPG